MTTPVQRRQARLRVILALLRLVLYGALLAALLLFMGLSHRALLETIPSATETASPIPFLGANVDLTFLSPSERQMLLADLRAHQVGWVRQRVDWGMVEPAPGAYVWEEVDAILAAIEEAGLIPVLLLDGSPAWARSPQDNAPPNPYAPPVDPQTFADFAAMLATRHQAALRYYQIWDEPNIAPHWGNRHIDPVGYAQLLRAGAQAIRAADPDAVILGAALAPTVDRGHTALDEIAFLERMLAGGARAGMDVVAVQPFGFGHAPWDWRPRPAVLNFARVALIRQRLDAAGADDLPLWAVRMGWNVQPASPWGTVTTADQLVYAETAVALGMRTMPWLQAMAWTGVPPNAPVHDPVHGFALHTDLLDALQRGLDAPPPQAPATASGLPIRWALLLLACAFSLWRGGCAVALLPWARWRSVYTTGGTAMAVLCWAALVAAYHLATWPPLIGLLILMAAGLVWLRPRDGLLVGMMVLPFIYRHKEIQWVTGVWLLQPGQAVAIALLPALATTLWRGRRPLPELLRHLQPLDWLAVALPLISLLSVFGVWHWPGYLAGLAELVWTPLVLYGAVRLWARTDTARTQVVGALFLGGVLVAAYGLWGWTGGQGTMADGVRRLVGPYFSPNHTALYLLRATFLGAGLTLAWLWHKPDGRLSLLGSDKRRGVVATLWGTATCLVGGALLLTASRGALLLGLPMGLMALAFLVRDYVRGTRQRPVGNALLTMVLMLGLILMLFGDRLRNSATVLERLRIWQTTLQLWVDFPVAGVGPGGFYWRFPAYIPIGQALDPNLRHPHCVWLEQVAFWGTAGLVWLLNAIWATGVTASRAWRRIQPPARMVLAGLLAGLVAGFAHAQVDAFATLPDLAAWNWVALALLAGYGETQR